MTGFREAIHRAAKKAWIAASLSLLAMTAKHAFAFSRHGAPEVCLIHSRLKKTEGAGKAGCPLHPQSRVRNKKAHERRHHRFTGLTRPSLRNGFNGLFRALPGDEFVLSPSSAN
jgi:hypothetical protein